MSLLRFFLLLFVYSLLRNAFLFDFNCLLVFGDATSRLELICLLAFIHVSLFEFICLLAFFVSFF